MSAISPQLRSSPAVKWTVGYLIVWTILLFEIRTLQMLPNWGHIVWGSLSVALVWYWWKATSENHHRSRLERYLIATVAFILWWQLTLVVLDTLIMDSARANVARWGTASLFMIGLLWMVWGVERASVHYQKIKQNSEWLRDASNEKSANTKLASVVWNPLNLDAHYYAVQWWPPRPVSLLRSIRNRQAATALPRAQRSPKLDQSLLALISYTLLFLLVALLFSQIGGCREIYEMPAGGGEQQQLAQVVKIKKVIRKKYIINPLSSIIFAVPPIDDVQLELTEITKHAYQIGQGEGKGAGFSGGTYRGKVRFIRLEYSGGDWDQDYGVGGDLNMLLEYGIRTQHKVAERTESRTIGQLANFPLGKSPPLVYMTGQKNISLSNSEVKTLREYLTDKHGMLFGDNGGSRHFHNQFLSMMNRVLPNVKPVPIPLDDVIHRIPYQIPYLPYVAPHGGKEALGWYKDGRWLAYYHPGDIGDAWSDGHAGVSADIWESCYRIGTNVTFYAHSEYSKWLDAQEKD